MRFPSYFSRFDQSETIRNAKQLLQDYPHYKRLELATRPTLHSPQIDCMPPNHSAENGMENAMIRHVYFVVYVSACERTIANLPNDMDRKILKTRYLDGHTDSYTMKQVGLEHSAYGDAKNQALIAFAELCPPLPDYGQLIVYRSS